jgi:ribonuclease D
MIEHYHWVGSNEALNLACQRWQIAPVLALDTEFVRTETFFAKLGLIQVGLEGEVWLIDPLAIDDWQTFAAVLENPGIIKVFHSLSEDAEVLFNGTGAQVSPVFDTQIAAALLGNDLQMGFARAVEAELGEVIPKDATRSNWVLRPLGEEQCQYAAADVFWLERLYERYAPVLKAGNRFDWVLEDSQRAALDSFPPEPEVYYLKLRGAWKLKGARLHCLQQLAQWREQQAREKDVNRSRILSDAEIIQIAQAMPAQRNAFASLKGMHPRKTRQYADDVVDIVRRCSESSRELWPERLAGPLPVDQAELYKSVKELIAVLARQESVPPEVLARRKPLEQLVRSGSYTGDYQWPEMMTGWRKPLIVAPLTRLLEEYHRETND